MLESFSGGVAESVTSKSNVLYIRFFTEKTGIKLDFKSFIRSVQVLEGGVCNPVGIMTLSFFVSGSEKWGGKKAKKKVKSGERCLLTYEWGVSLITIPDLQKVISTFAILCWRFNHELVSEVQPDKVTEGSRDHLEALDIHGVFNGVHGAVELHPTLQAMGEVFAILLDEFRVNAFGLLLSRGRPADKHWCGQWADFQKHQKQAEMLEWL